jgi:DNA repair exonuclease SbcCD ATPase subunit
MLPISLTLKDFGSFTEATVPFSELHLTAIVGPNGAGKSTILDAIRVALYGSAAGSLDGFIRQGAHGWRVVFTFDVGGMEYIVTREHGKAQKASLVRADTPLCEAKVRDVDAAIVALLGCDHAGFTLAHLLPQGALGAFAAIAPADRQAWIAANMPTEKWSALEMHAKAVLIEEKAALTTLDARRVAFEMQAGDSTLMAEELVSLIEQREQKAHALAKTEALADAQSEARARRNVLEAELTSADGRLHRATDTLASMPANIPEVEPDIARYEARLEWYQTAEALLRQFLEAERGHVGACDARTAFVTQKKPTCPLCLQSVKGAAYDETHSRMTVAVKVTGDAEMEADRALATHMASGGALKCEPPTDTTQAHNAALAASDALTGARELSRAFALRGQMDDLMHEREEASALVLRINRDIAALPVLGSDEDPSESAKALRGYLADLDQRIGRLTAGIEASDRARLEVEAAEQERSILVERIDALGLLAKAYGRTGIVARIVESAVESIEGYANDFLSRFTDGMTLELRTQRENKTGGLRETLDIMVSDANGTRAMENYSGGEKTRVNFALAVGLARFLSTHHEGNIDSFMVDEPEYLDRAGIDELVRCLHVLSESVSFVGIISHVDGVADAMPQRIVVSKGASGSKVRVEA